MASDNERFYDATTDCHEHLLDEHEYIVSTLPDLCNNNQLNDGYFIVVISKQVDNEYSCDGCLLGSDNGDISSMMEMANNAAWGVSNGILQRLVDLLYASQQLGNITRSWLSMLLKNECLLSQILGFDEVANIPIQVDIEASNASVLCIYLSNLTIDILLNQSLLVVYYYPVILYL